MEPLPLDICNLQLQSHHGNGPPGATENRLYHGELGGNGTEFMEFHEVNPLSSICKGVVIDIDRLHKTTQDKARRDNTTQHTTIQDNATQHDIHVYIRMQTVRS